VGRACPRTGDWHRHHGSGPRAHGHGARGRLFQRSLWGQGPGEVAGKRPGKDEGAGAQGPGARAAGRCEATAGGGLQAGAAAAAGPRGPEELAAVLVLAAGALPGPADPLPAVCRAAWRQSLCHALPSSGPRKEGLRAAGAPEHDRLPGPRLQGRLGSPGGHRGHVRALRRVLESAGSARLLPRLPFRAGRGRRRCEATGVPLGSRRGPQTCPAAAVLLLPRPDAGVCQRPRPPRRGLPRGALAGQLAAGPQPRQPGAGHLHPGGRAGRSPPEGQTQRRCHRDVDLRVVWLSHPGLQAGQQL